MSRKKREVTKSQKGAKKATTGIFVKTWKIAANSPFVHYLLMISLFHIISYLLVGIEEMFETVTSMLASAALYMSFILLKRTRENELRTQVLERAEMETKAPDAK